jgi:8-oxo-dGTP pyrophosphatase MutT (NUDIX family)
MTERRINVRAVIYKNGTILAQQLVPKTGVDRNYWCTPGGGLDPGESLFDGLTREMIEETGIAPVIGKLLFIEQFDDGMKEQLEFFFHVTNVDDYDTIDLSKTTHGQLETTNIAFIVPSEHRLLPAFLQTIDIQSYLDSNLPVLIDNDLPAYQ